MASYLLIIGDREALEGATVSPSELAEPAASYTRGWKLPTTPMP